MTETRSATRLAKAVVFDFDGTLVDTEWSIYEMAAESFAEFGIELEVPAWSQVVGLADGQWWPKLLATNGWAIDEAAWWKHYKSLDRSFRDKLPPVAGTVALLDDLAARGVPLAVASSSEVAWLTEHLGRLNLLNRFTFLAGADLTGGIGKPSPDVYLLACAELGVDPSDAVAVEDSAHGVTSARAAGMACVAIPSRITGHTDLSAADLIVGSLATLTVEQLLTVRRQP